MDRYLSRARMSAAIDSALRSLSAAITFAGEAHLFHHEAQLSEALFECVQIRREVLELPRETGVPPILEEPADPSENEIPF